MKKTLVTRMLGRVILMRESRESPLDAEWDEFLKLLGDNRARFDELRMMVITEGGGPDRLQRNRLEATLQGKSIRVAVVSDSAKVRFIASAVALLNPDHRGFAVREMNSAYEYLNLTAEERALIEKAEPEMAAQIK